MLKKFSFVSLEDEKDSEGQTWGEKLYENVLVPILSDLGYQYSEQENLERQRGFFSLVDMRRLIEDDLVVFDLSDGDPLVFYKLAIRHILQKPVIHLIRQDTSEPFKIEGMYVIEVNINNPMEIEASKRKIKEQIYSVEGIQVSLPYVAQLMQLLTVFESADSNRNREAVFNLLSQFENINTSLSHARQDLDVLSYQFIYGKNEVSPSPFVEKRLAKVELISMRHKERKTPYRKSLSR